MLTEMFLANRIVSNEDVLFIRAFEKAAADVSPVGLYWEEMDPTTHKYRPHHVPVTRTAAKGYARDFLRHYCLKGRDGEELRRETVYKIASGEHLRNVTGNPPAERVAAALGAYLEYCRSTEGLHRWMVRLANSRPGVSDERSRRGERLEWREDTTP